VIAYCWVFSKDSLTATVSTMQHEETFTFLFLQAFCLFVLATLIR
jgi:nitrate reductase NapE component